MNIDDLKAHIKASTQHRNIYHFTDRSNIPSIAKHGLVSKTRMRAENWWPETTGGNELSHQLDDARGISDYVSLCFTRNHPMKYLANQDGRLPAPCYLGISPDVLSLPGVRVAFGVANGNETKIMDIGEAIDLLDLEVIYSRTEWGNPAVQERLRAAERMEILIPDLVPRPLILGTY